MAAMEHRVNRVLEMDYRDLKVHLGLQEAMEKKARKENRQKVVIA
jgi:hypothetical protein